MKKKINKRRVSSIKSWLGNVIERERKSTPVISPRPVSIRKNTTISILADQRCCFAQRDIFCISSFLYG